MVFMIWMAAGLQEIIILLAARWRYSWVPVSLILILALVWQVVQVAPKVDASKDSRAETFGQTEMQILPKNALVFTHDDETTFTLWYFHYGLKQRPDVTVITEGLLKFDWYRATLGYTYPDLYLPKSGDISAASISGANQSRPNCLIKDHLTTVISCSNQ